MIISLIRHAKPEKVSSKAIYATEMIEWVAHYNSAAICSFPLPTDKLKISASQSNLMLTSDLSRSKDSATVLTTSQTVIENSIFAEAELPISKYKLFKATPAFWLITFRLLWYLGYSNGCESRKDAKERSKKAVTELINRAEQHQHILLVGHGIFNRFLANELIRQGFSGEKYPNSKYWGFSMYKKV